VNTNNNIKKLSYFVYIICYVLGLYSGYTYKQSINSELRKQKNLLKKAFLKEAKPFHYNKYINILFEDGALYNHAISEDSKQLRQTKEEFLSNHNNTMIIIPLKAVLKLIKKDPTRYVIFQLTFSEHPSNVFSSSIIHSNISISNIDLQIQKRNIKQYITQFKNVYTTNYYLNDSINSFFTKEHKSIFNYNCNNLRMMCKKVNSFNVKRSNTLIIFDRKYKHIHLFYEHADHSYKKYLLVNMSQYYDALDTDNKNDNAQYQKLLPYIRETFDYFESHQNLN